MAYSELKDRLELLQNLQVLWQYSQVLHLQVNTFFKYWLNIHEYYHNTSEYWTCEYTQNFINIHYPICR